jgi:hypothetical protein
MRRYTSALRYHLYLTIAAVTLIRGGVHLFEKSGKPSLSEGKPTFTPRLLSNQREALLEAAPLKIGLLMVADAKAQFKYERTIASMRNYTASHGYGLLVWDPRESLCQPGSVWGV